MLRAVAACVVEGTAMLVEPAGVYSIELALAVVSGVFGRLLRCVARRLRFLVGRSPAANLLATGKPL